MGPHPRQAGTSSPPRSGAAPGSFAQSAVDISQVQVQRGEQTRPPAGHTLLERLRLGETASGLKRGQIPLQLLHRVDLDVGERMGEEEPVEGAARLRGCAQLFERGSGTCLVAGLSLPHR
jgi:hypothetical protein